MQPSDTELRQLAAEILERPEFTRWRGLDDDLVRWIADQLSSIASWLDVLSDTAPLLFALVLFGMCAVAIGLIAHITWSIRAALVTASPVVVPPPRATRPRFSEEARMLAQQGRYLEAAHRLQLASLELLLERGVIELARHESNRKLRERLARSSLPDDLRVDLMRSIDQLQVRWFRERRAGPELYEDWRTLHARLLGSGASA